MNQSGLFKVNDVAKYLIEREFIMDVGDKYQIDEWRYMVKVDNLNEIFKLLTNQLYLLTHTIISLKSDDIKRKEKYQMKAYSTQTHPKNHSFVKTKIREILTIASKKTREILEKYEDDVPFNTYPAFGASLFIFDEIDEQLKIEPTPEIGLTPFT